ncbi:MAG: Asp-tRNA(Asn)/Glu-tRNA(Gln) amidotransferase subunit GatA [Chlamydiia bacterium]
MTQLPHSCYELREAIATGALSAEAITRQYVERIRQRNAQVGAYLHTMEERALAKARLVDEQRQAGKPLGRLAGVPLAIKDNIQILGEPTTCASRILDGYVAPFSAHVIEALESEGAILLGKTNMDEFAMGSSTENSALRSTHNPWNLKCVPGGSSGGSAAAVASGMALASLGSETGGSVRQPAAFCGLVGLKPTYGRISRYGLVAFGSSLDQISPFTTSVRDMALLMEVLARPDHHDATSIQQPMVTPSLRSDLKGVKLGVPRHLLDGLDANMAKAFSDAEAAAKAAGAQIVEVSLPLIRYSVAVYYIVATAEASTNLSRFDGVRYGRRSPQAQTLDQLFDLSREQGFGAEVKRRILLGTFVLSAGYQDAYYRRAQRVRALMKRETEEALKVCDAILMPTTTTPAFERGAIQEPLQMYLQDLYTILASLVGMPAVSLPCGLVNGLPVGVQLMTGQKQDAELLQIASGLEPFFPKLTCPYTPVGA